MSIAKVIGWKFNHQPGMSCREIDGVMRIVEFPGGIPSQTDQDRWSVEYEAAKAAEAAARTAALVAAEMREQAIDALLAKAALDPLAPQEVKDYVAKL